MVSMKAYSHLTLQEREFIYVQTHQGESSRAPARKLGRDHATVVRELKRNSKPDPDAKTLIYSPSVAEQLAGQRRHHMSSVSALLLVTADPQTSIAGAV